MNAKTAERQQKLHSDQLESINLIASDALSIELIDQRVALKQMRDARI